MLPELSREEVDRIMTTLKKEKESLVLLRAQIPTQLHLYQQAMVQRESLEAGAQEVSSWLDQVEGALSASQSKAEMITDRETLIALLDAHKVFLILYLICL